MSEASRHRSLTPSIEVQHMTDPLISVFRRLKSRSYNSADELTVPAEKSGSNSPASSAKTVIYDETPLLDTACLPAPSPAPAPTVDKPRDSVPSRRQMFAQYFSLTRAGPAQPETPGAVVGDFDNTPLPSSRPSFEDMASPTPEKDAASSFSSASKLAGHRHALLKKTSGQPTATDRDLPVPPVLSRESSADAVPTQSRQQPGTAAMTRIVAPGEEASFRATQSPSPGRLPIEPPKNPDSQRGRICIDPAIHTIESHAKAHHSGLLKGADFCDAGVSGEPARQRPFSPAGSGVVSSGSSEPEVVRAQVQRTLTGDDFCSTTIPIEIPKHSGHSHATRIRPAADLTPFYHHANLNRGQYDHPAVSKVIPFDASRESEDPDELERDTTTEASHLLASLHSGSLPVHTASVEDELPRVSQSNRGDASNIRPFIEHPLEVEDHSDRANTSNPGKVSRSVSVAHSDGRKVSKAYHKLDQFDASAPCLGHQPVSKVQLYCEQPEVSEEDQTFATDSDASLHDGDDNPRTSPSTKTSPSRATTLDYRRTAQWLRDLLMNRDGYSATLTDLPEREKRGSRGNIGNENVEPLPALSARSSVPSRSLTRNSTLPPSKIEPGAFKHAVNEMERLLDEALAVACQIVDRRESIQGGAESSPPPPVGQSSGEGSFPINFKEDFDNVDLDDRDGPEKRQPKRAATLPVPPRPRLRDLVDNYDSHPLVPKVTKTLEVRAPRDSCEDCVPCTDETCQVPRPVRALRIPDRGSSMQQRAVRRQKPGRQAPLYKCPEVSSLDGLSDEVDIIDFKTQYSTSQRNNGSIRTRMANRHAREASDNTSLPERDVAGRPMYNSHGISLRNKSHASLRGTRGFNLPKSHRRQPIARDWSPIRKQYVATVACTSTALIGVLLGIYAGIVPSIQYYILDTTHAIIYGNVGCFFGMALPTFFCWPLPLLHGRKPYILGGLIVSMALLFPQALAVYSQRFHNIPA